MTGAMHLPLEKRHLTERDDTGSGLGSRPHIGMIATSNDQSLPYEARAMLGCQALLYTSARAVSPRT
jgi:hypothetical protein